MKQTLSINRDFTLDKNTLLSVGGELYITLPPSLVSSDVRIVVNGEESQPFDLTTVKIPIVEGESELIIELTILNVNPTEIHEFKANLKTFKGGYEYSLFKEVQQQRADIINLKAELKKQSERIREMETLLES